MQITFLQNGKTEENYLKEGIAIFEQRIHRYLPYQSEVIPALKNTKNLPVAQQKQKEFELMRKWFEKSDCVVLLDEHGKEFSSVQFAEYLQGKMNAGIRNLTFVVGGPYGFAPEAYAQDDLLPPDDPSPVHRAALPRVLDSQPRTLPQRITTKNRSTGQSRTPIHN